MSWKDDEKLWDIIGPTHVDELEEFGYVVIKKTEFEKLEAERTHRKIACREWHDCEGRYKRLYYQSLKLEEKIKQLVDREEFDDGAKY